jgi:hypothetical protein
MFVLTKREPSLRARCWHIKSGYLIFGVLCFRTLSNILDPEDENLKSTMSHLTGPKSLWADYFIAKSCLGCCGIVQFCFSLSINTAAEESFEKQSSFGEYNTIADLQRSLCRL